VCFIILNSWTSWCVPLYKITVTTQVRYNVGSHFRSSEVQPIELLWRSLVLWTEGCDTISTNYVF
jgi:hypothetical protein